MRRAPFFSRLTAYCLDLAVWSIWSSCISALFGFLFPAAVVASMILKEPPVSSLVIPSMVLLLLLLWGVCIGIYGQTPGKYAMDIQVVDYNSKQPVGLLRLYLREVLKVLFMPLYVFMCCCGLSILDVFMETQVVEKREKNE